MGFVLVEQCWSQKEKGRVRRREGEGIDQASWGQWVSSWLVGLRKGKEEKKRRRGREEENKNKKVDREGR